MRTGTREWSDFSKNFINGCSHDCKYCYAKSMALRFKRKTKDNWKEMKINNSKLHEKPRKLNGRIMVPTTHDITPEIIDNTIQYLKRWLNEGNELLITSKPHLECIKRICDDLKEFKSQIVFRFTIGSPNNDVLKFWEHGAPSYEERVECLKYAFEKGFTTSVSCEPYLDSDIALMVSELLPYINDTIWIGKMNRINQRVDTTEWKKEDFKYLDMVKESQTDEFVQDLYDDLKDNPKVRWKDSIKRVMNLPEEDIG